MGWKSSRQGMVIHWIFRIILLGLLFIGSVLRCRSGSRSSPARRADAPGGRRAQVESSRRIAASVAKKVLRCSPQASTRRTNRRPPCTTWHGSNMKRLTNRLNSMRTVARRAPLYAQVLAPHDHPGRLLALARPVVELGHVLADQANVLVAALAHDRLF